MVALATAFVRLRPSVSEREYVKAGEQAGKVFGERAGRALAGALNTTVRRAAERLGREAGSEYADGFTREAKRQTRDVEIGPDKARTAKQGRESAGSFADAFKRQIEQASRTLPPLTVGVAKNAAEQAIRDIQARLRDLSGKTIGVDLDAGAAIAQVRALEGELRDLAASSPDIQVQADTTAALARLGQITASVDRIDGRTARVEVDVDTERAQRGVNSLATRLTSGLGTVFSGISNTASSFFQSLSRGAAEAGGQITSSVLSAAASGTVLTAVTGGLNLVVGAAVAVLVGAAGAVGLLTAGFIALAPVLQITGGLLGASIGLLFGVAAATATLKLGLGGVGGAYSAMVAAQDEASKSSASFASSQNAVASASDQVKSALAAQANTRANIAEASRRAAQQIADAERSVGQARAEAARQAKSSQEQILTAMRRVRTEQLSLTEAERNALDVRKELTRAQRDARESMEDLASRVKDNALEQRQALLDVSEAQKERDKVISDPKSTQAQREQAQITFERQYKQLTDLRREGQRLAADQAEANKKGIEGSDQVVQARKRIADADKGVVDARKSVKDAEDGVRKAQDAAAESRRQGQDRINAAERALDEARRSRDNQQRQSAYQLSQASQAVVSAQRALKQASVQAGQAGGSALEKLNQQMDELSPNAQDLVKTLFDLRTPFTELRKFVSDRLLAGVGDQVRDLAEKWFPALKSILGDTADRLNVIGDGLFKTLGSKTFIDNIKATTGAFGRMLSRIGESLPGVLDAFGRIGAASEPVLRVIGDLIGGIFDKFSDWIRTADESGALDTFMKDAADTLQRIFDLSGKVFTIIGQLIKIFFPDSKESSGGFLDGVERNLDNIIAYLNDPENQQAIRDWVDDIQDFIHRLTAEWIPRVDEWLDRVEDWVGDIDGWIDSFTRFGAAIATVFTGPYNLARDGWHQLRDNVFEPVRHFVADTIPGAFTTMRDDIGGTFGNARDRLDAIGVDIRDNVLTPVRNAITTTIPNAFATGRDRISARFNETRDRLGNTFGNIRDNTMNRLAAIMITTMPGAFGTGRDRMSARFGETRDRLGNIWATIRDNTFGRLTDAIQTTIPNAFRTGVDAIAGAWQRLEAVAREPVRFVVDTVLNQGLISGFNAVAGTFGVDKIDPIKLPKGFATGGVLPGYTPGRDVHRFVSATGGVLDLSGGEPVMRPEFGRAVGTGWVDGMNRAARTGGVAGVKRALSGSFASGGTIGDGNGLGDLWKRAKGKANDIIQGAKNLITNPAGSIKTLVDRLLRAMPNSTLPWSRLVAGAPRKLLEGAVNKLSGFIRGPGAGTSGPGNGKSPFGGSAGMMRALRAVFPGLPLISGYRPGARTLSGNPSYHGVDRAVDLPPREDVAKFIHDSYGPITKELITPYQKYNLLNGRKHTYRGAIWQQHNFAGGNAHDHFAAKLGGTMPKMQLFDSGGPWANNTIGINTSGRTEWVDPNRDRMSLGDVVDRLERIEGAILGDGDRLVEAQKVGTRRAGRVARGAR